MLENPHVRSQHIATTVAKDGTTTSKLVIETNADQTESDFEELVEAVVEYLNARNRLEGRGEIRHVEKIADTLGRSQPARKPTVASFISPATTGAGRQPKAALADKRDVKDARIGRRREAGGAGCTVRDLSSLITAGKKFGGIYADPPWLYDNQGTRAATSNHYDGMTVDELCALPIRALAADDAHLHLWTIWIGRKSTAGRRS
jgi:hypothetical protein